MSKVIALLAVIAGGTATYMWRRKNGGTSHLDSHIGDAANKLRSAFGTDDSSNHAVGDLKEKTKDARNDVAEQMEAAGG